MYCVWTLPHVSMAALTSIRLPAPLPPSPALRPLRNLGQPAEAIGSMLTGLVERDGDLKDTDTDEGDETDRSRFPPTYYDYVDWKRNTREAEAGVEAASAAEAAAEAAEAAEDDGRLQSSTEAAGAAGENEAGEDAIGDADAEEGSSSRKPDNYYEYVTGGTDGSAQLPDDAALDDEE